MKEQTAAFFEAITPGIQAKFTRPGETLSLAYEKLKVLDLQEIKLLLKVLEQFDQLDDETLIRMRVMFESTIHPNI